MDAALRGNKQKNIRRFGQTQKVFTLPSKQCEINFGKVARFTLGILSLTQENSLNMNAALRFVVGLKKSDHITPTHKALGLLPYEARRTHLCLSLLANILHNAVPNYLSSRFHFRDKDNSRSKRRSNLDLEIMWARAECYKKSFVIHAACLWNNLPENVRQLYTRPIFKLRLKLHLFDSVFKNV